MTDAAAISLDARPWNLAALADPAEFDWHIETAAAAIADRFTLQTHINLEARRGAFGEWIDHLRTQDGRRLDYRTFISVCAGLIAALASRRVVGYSTMLGNPGRMAAAVVKFGPEITALAVGRSLYAVAIEDLEGGPTAEPLPALVVENAAANLRRHPEAALRFRELMRLPTPWT